MGRVNIGLCMGSACFARGNNRLLEMIEDAIEKNGWKEWVVLTGARCENRCGDGPIVVLDGKRLHGLDASAILALVHEKVDAAVAAPKS